MFAHGVEAKVKNIIFENVNISSNFAFIGTVFGKSEGCEVQSITVTTSHPSISNIIVGNGSSASSVGGIVGYGTHSYIYNCVVQNTVLNAPNFERIGGIVGKNFYYFNFNF